MAGRIKTTHTSFSEEMNPIGRDNGELSCLATDFQIKSRWYRLRSDIPGLKKRCVDSFSSLRLFNIQNINVPDDRTSAVSANDKSSVPQIYMKILQLGTIEPNVGIWAS